MAFISMIVNAVAADKARAEGERMMEKIGGQYDDIVAKFEEQVERYLPGYELDLPTSDEIIDGSNGGDSTEGGEGNSDKPESHPDGVDMDTYGV